MTEMHSVNILIEKFFRRAIFLAVLAACRKYQGAMTE